MSMLAQKHALANYFLVWILFGHTFIALAQNAEAEKSDPNEEFGRDLRGDMGFSRILRGGNSGFTRILRSPGAAGFSRILRDPAGFSRILRDRSFSRILRSDPDIHNEQLDEEKRSPSSFTRILRGPGDLNSFSRILRGSFSRILKRDAGNSGFTRILRSPGAGFSRILRSPTSFSRILRGDMGFSRILRDHDRVPEEIEESDDDDTSYPARSLRTSGFSRIL